MHRSTLLVLFAVVATARLSAADPHEPVASNGASIVVTASLSPESLPAFEGSLPLLGPSAAPLHAESSWFRKTLLAPFRYLGRVASLWRPDGREVVGPPIR